MSQAAKFRELLASRKMIVAPGAIDGLTGTPDRPGGLPRGLHDRCRHVGDVGLSRLRPDHDDRDGRQRHAHRQLDLDPADQRRDTGYGNELNVFRTVQEFERVGVAAIHIEDQVFPKKCGHLDSKELVSREDYIAKIRAAAAARKSKPDFCIIARTDSRAVVGFDEAIERANSALANGADVAFVEAPQTLEEVAAVPKRGQGTLPPERRARRQNPGDRARRRRTHGLRHRHPARSAAGRHHLGLRPAAGRREAQRQAAARGGRLARPRPLPASAPPTWDERRTAFRDVIKAAAE